MHFIHWIDQNIHNTFIVNMFDLIR